MSLVSDVGQLRIELAETVDLGVDDMSGIRSFSAALAHLLKNSIVAGTWS